MSPTKLEFFAIYHACYKHQLINVKSGIKNIRWHNCEHYFYKKRTCSWSEKFRLRGKFPNVVSTSILFDCWRLLVETIFSMLNQNRNFRVTILNPERCIKYDRFKIRAFADQQNYQKYLFCYLGWCPWTPKERFFEKNFCCKSSLWPHYLFQYCLSQNATERQHAKILSFSTSVRLVWRAEGTWQFRKKDAAVLNFEICHLLFDLTW